MKTSEGHIIEFKLCLNSNSEGIQMVMKVTNQTYNPQSGQYVSATDQSTNVTKLNPTNKTNVDLTHRDADTIEISSGQKLEMIGDVAVIYTKDGEWPQKPIAQRLADAHEHASAVAHAKAEVARTA